MTVLHILLIILGMIMAAFQWSAPGDVEDEGIVFGDYQHLWHGYRTSPALSPHPDARRQAEHGTGPEIIQTLKYCFVDERPHKNLGKILTQAIAKWAHAMTVSSLRSDLAPSAGGDPMRYCSELDKSDMDTLAIEDVTRDGDADWNNGKSAQSSGAGDVEDKPRRCATETTTGYTYIDSKAGEMGGNHRHTLNLCMRDPDNPPAGESEEWHEAAMQSAFSTKYQRPDRDEYLWIRWKNLEGFAEMQAAVKTDERGILDNPYDSDDSGHSAFEGYDQRTREYEARAEEHAAAAAYFPIAPDYIKGDHYNYEPKKSEFASYAFSSKFDYDSIMIYSSTMATPAGSTKYSITRKTGNGLQPVWMGVSSDV
ncbi:hypothetical protein DOTSEDRAFT_31578 [Dothistroma septosporum NZE10]|uniref:Uncharacterized protein n=1 Tax=Dothistroma septosporum (strain NZE10 / CBS 128990) TaxID=675120 RepID=N1PXE9_DOTSN|nr:hypothetical protein DOTSEDRAFT_31578 [Dothistroma septosporum NZE10]